MTRSLIYSSWYNSISELEQNINEHIPKKYHSLVLGIQGQLWSETLTHESYLDTMINPRLAALAEVAWSSSTRRNWKNFRPSLFEAVKITKKLGWNNHKF